MRLPDTAHTYVEASVHVRVDGVAGYDRQGRERRQGQAVDDGPIGVSPQRQEGARHALVGRLKSSATGTWGSA